MALRLVEVREPNRKAILVGITDSVDFGRDCDGLLLTDTEVSRSHARVEIRGDDVVVVDLGSTNGTTVNGTRIEEPTVISEADLVLVGRAEIQLLRAATGEVPAQGTSVSRSSGPPRATAVAGSGADATVRGRADSGKARQT
ncbi:MAG TPA: FHA domain-containing protein, partial [Acidimicrobiia bacterium]|nr:FHA domain-containing protein [Acidimicrobiia bacterium]